jgi:hypothetical protein
MKPQFMYQPVWRGRTQEISSFLQKRSGGDCKSEKIAVQPLAADGIF